MLLLEEYFVKNASGARPTLEPRCRAPTLRGRSWRLKCEARRGPSRICPSCQWPLAQEEDPRVELAGASDV